MDRARRALEARRRVEAAVQRLGLTRKGVAHVGSRKRCDVARDRASVEPDGEPLDAKRRMED